MSSKKLDTKPSALSNATRWRGIYNFNHPGNKWPSFTIALLMGLCCMLAGQSPVENKVQLPLRTNEQTISASPSSNSKATQLTKVKKDVHSLSSASQINKTIPILKADERKLLNETAFSKANQTVQSEEEAVRTSKTTSIGSFSSISNSNESDDHSQTVHLPVSSWKSDNHPLHFEVYTTPVIMNVINASNPVPLNRTLVTQGTNSNNHDINSKMYKSWEIEAGGALLFDVTQDVRLKAGMQLNYANYIFIPGNDGLNNDNVHGTAESPKSSSDAATNFTINNPIYQLSIPLGTELKLVGNGSLDWFAGASVQPTLLLSDPGINHNNTDENLESAHSMFRKWNVHSTLETFVSVRLNKHAAFKIGPQLRYQFMPSLLPSYTISERMYNLGIKLGITGGF